jgi:hypothetical protein
VVTAAPRSQYPSGAVSHGQGGAVVVWDDHRTDPVVVCLLRLTGDGAALWTPDGVPDRRAFADGRRHSAEPGDPSLESVMVSKGMIPADRDHAFRSDLIADSGPPGAAASKARRGIADA